MTDLQSQRYKRHILLPEIGEEGQRKLLDGSVLVVGAGGLGAPLLLYLAAAGIGHIGIVDFDRVDVSNLQRQVLFTTEDVGNLKAESALGRIKALNPDVDVVAYNFRFDAVNARKLVADYDVVLDATDDIGTKYLINDTCVENGTPFVHAAVNCYGGNVMTVVPGSACLRCVFPEAVKQKDSSEYGVFGAVPGIAGAVQAAEVVKLIAGVGEPLVNRMMSFDALAMKFNVISVVPSDLCVLRHSE
ncbi:MAG: HesA/MoeB/ThiF family protein [Bacteroidetes bacterium]|uniref:Molybdopterin-synthase adenylyltransferase n=1 Tax=Candidatus Limisoma faecipullorum TaxID=2840854 RepID=A0A9D9IQ63_9BACT|nr:HesA/MoeB/ThiF family protein [Candidatus Limisoma faecipullorum]